jgi:glycosyltransferase involved in cell wall biosynthesis
MSKLIHLITHLPFAGDSPRRHLTDGWQARTAREIAKRTGEFEIESWLPAEIASPYVERKGSVTYRAFPAHMRPFANSPSILKAAEGLDDDAILHIHGDRSFITYSLMGNPRRKFVQHHGSSGFSVMTPIETVSLRRPEMIYCISRLKVSYLRLIGIPPHRLRFQTMGVDFDVFRPHPKSESRRKLGIDEDSKVILHPARLGLQKGTDVVLAAYDKLKSRFDNIQLVLVGGNESDPYYEEARRRTKHVFTRVPHEQMPYFYSAADVTCYFWRPPALLYGSGGAVSVLESLACDTPVASNTLIHFKGLDGMEHVGEIPASQEGMADAIVRVLEGGHFDCRARSEKHFSWDSIVSAILKDYHSAGS